MKRFCGRMSRVLLLIAWTAAMAGVGQLWPAGFAVNTAFAQAQPTSATQATTNKARLDEESWQVIYIGDQRVGYARVTTRTEDRKGRKIIHTENDTHMTIKRFGQELKIQTTLRTEETEQGDMLGYVFEMKNPPATTTSTVGKVVGNKLEVETLLAGRRSKRSLNWDADVKSPAYQDRLMRARGLKPGHSLSFKTFLPELNKVTTVKVVADDMRLTKLLDGKQHSLLKIRITQSIIPTLTVRGYVDDKGETLKTETGFLGTSMVTYTVTKDVALETIAGAELDIAVSSLVEVKPIRRAHQTKKIVYRLTTPDDDPAKYIVVGGTQSIKRVSDDTIDLTVTAVAIPRNVRIVRGAPEFVSKTRFLQSDDPKVVQHARFAAAGLTDHSEIAKRMEKYVSDKLTKKNFSTALASAAEVADKLEGDCTEHAVLLAAMLRVKQIPSKVAVGMVYVQSRASFGGHMWTEAFLGGKWIPLDATLGQGGIGAAHIKLAESSFADDAPTPVTTFLPLLNVLGKLKIEVLDVQ